jgi:ferredoxin
VTDIVASDIENRGDECLSREDFKRKVQELIPDKGHLDDCIACNTCSSRCPASGLEGMDPRKFLHLILTGRYEEACASPWVWMCSMCKRCQVACPMDINIPLLTFYARSTWPRNTRPTGILGSCNKAITTETCSAMGLPLGDWTWVVEDVLEELTEEAPEWADLQAPMDKQGAEFVLNQNSREPGHEPEEMIPLWKILHTVGADWTYTSKAFAAENYCMFLADDPGWEAIIRAKVAAVEEVGAKTWLNTE